MVFQHAVFTQRQREIESRLAADGREHGIGLFLRDDRFERFGGEWFDVGRIREVRVCHDGRGIRVDQHHAVALGFQCLHRLGAGIIELRRLPDDDGA